MTSEMQIMWQCLYGIVMIGLGSASTLIILAIRKAAKLEKYDNIKIQKNRPSSYYPE